jgi:putative NIF3 family GTP cyclohydrolase 1 type 2
MRAAAGFHAHDAFWRQRAGHREQALVFLGVDVVGDDHQAPALAHRLAQHFHQRGLAAAHRAADAHAQGGQLLGAAGDVVQ